MSVVVFAPNWLGDAVMALPAIADLRRQHADASFVVAARPAVADLFELVPGVDAVVRLSGRAEGSPWRRFGEDAARLRHVGASRAVLLPNSARAALLAWRAGIPERCGYRRDLRGLVLTKAVARAGRGLHQVDYYRHLAESIGATPGPREPVLEVLPDARAEAAALLRDAGWDGARPLLGVAPGAAFGGAKRWPEDRFAQALGALARQSGVVPVLVGSAADQPIACTVAGQAGKITGAEGTPGVIDLSGRTGLRQLAGVLAGCAAFLSNDSGAMHLAAAIGVPVVGIFGPTDERATAPLGRVVDGVPRPVRIVAAGAWCRPCGLRECPIDHRCMTRIGVDAVVGAVRDIL